MTGFTPKIVMTLPGSFEPKLTASWLADARQAIQDAVVVKVQVVDPTILKAEIEIELSVRSPVLLRDGTVEYYPKMNLGLPDRFIRSDPAWVADVADVISDAILDSLGVDFDTLKDTEISWKHGLSTTSRFENEAERKARLGI